MPVVAGSAQARLAAVWHSGALILVLLAPAQLRLGQAIWTLSAPELPQTLAPGLAYAAAALWLSLAAPALRNRTWLHLAGALAFWFGAVQLYLSVLPGIANSRGLFLIALVLAAILLGLPRILARLPAPVMLLPLAASAVLVGLGLRPRPAELDAQPGDRTIVTSLAPVTLRVFRGLVGDATTGGGAIRRYGDGWLLGTSRGSLYRLARDAENNLRAHQLALSVPLDHEAFLADLRSDSLPLGQADSLADTATAALRRVRDRFRVSPLRVTGLVLDTTATPALLYVAHLHWSHAGKCFTVRVVRAPLPPVERQPAGPSSEWETLFESQPCLRLFSRLNTSEGGGRLAWHPSGHLLLSLGDFGFNGIDLPAFSQSAGVDYGKVLRLDLAGHHKTFASGLRNPQGLLLDRQGRIWETEHGPQGGDELNLLQQDGNYGWPLVTYGTDYGRFDWPLARETSNHGGFIEPVQAFVPAIAISNLIELDSLPVREWRGDLLVASLRAKSLFRVRLAGTRVVYIERISIGRRIRDLAQGADGNIVLWTDEADLLVLARAGRDQPEVALGACLVCHAAGPGAPAPPLRSIVGKPVAADPYFDYSPALRKLTGNWTEARLAAFLRDPQAVAPGNGMGMLRLGESEISAIIEALKRYR